MRNKIAKANMAMPMTYSSDVIPFPLGEHGGVMISIPPAAASAVCRLCAQMNIWTPEAAKRIHANVADANNSDAVAIAEHYTKEVLAINIAGAGETPRRLRDFAYISVLMFWHSKRIEVVEPFLSQLNLNPHIRKLVMNNVEEFMKKVLIDDPRVDTSSLNPETDSLDTYFAKLGPISLESYNKKPRR